MGAGRTWTAEEVDYLEDSWGSVTIPGIAKKLNRSVNAVKIKAQRCGLGCHLHSGTRTTLHQLIVALGITGGDSYFTQRLIKAGCPVKHQRSVKYRYRVIDIDEFWKWAEQHKRMFDFSKMEVNALGKEPTWVNQKRIEDTRNFIRPHNSKWSKADDDLLRKVLPLYKYTYADLSKRLNRSEGAIKRRIHDLGIKQRPIRVESRLWTKEETTILLRLWQKGYSYERIASELGRTALQVRGKHERILNPEMSKRAYRNWREKEKTKHLQ